MLEAIASHDVKDSTSLQRQDTDFMAALTEDVQGMRIGIPNDSAAAEPPEEPPGTCSRFHGFLVTP